MEILELLKVVFLGIVEGITEWLLSVVPDI